MRAIRAASLASLIGASGCEGPPRVDDVVGDTSLPLGNDRSLISVVDDPDAKVASTIPTQVLADDDPVAALNTDERPLSNDENLVSLRGGTILELPPASIGAASRQTLTDELSIVAPRIAPEDLQELRIQWYRRGHGLVFQNTTEHIFSLSVHFEASADPTCEESVLRREIQPRESVAPAPIREGCTYDSAHLRLFDSYNLLVAEATIMPKEQP